MYACMVCMHGIAWHAWYARLVDGDIELLKARESAEGAERAQPVVA